MSKKVFFLFIVVFLFSANSLVAASVHDYFDALINRPDFYKGYSLRPRAGAPITSPYYEKQLFDNNLGGYQQTAAGMPTYVNYDPAMDAAKVVIPAWGPDKYYLESDLSLTDTTITGSWIGNSGWNNHSLKIDNEIVTVTGYAAGSNGHIINIIRGQFGTSPASHSNNTLLKKSTNSLTSQVRLPVGTQDGHTYLFTWTAMWDTSHIGLYTADGRAYTGSGATDKVFQLASNGIWLEENIRRGGGVAGLTDTGHTAVGFDPAQHIGGFSMRSYDSAQGPEIWDSTYTMNGPTVINNSPISPAIGEFIVKPNVPVRFWILIEQRANDYDLMSSWIADPTTGPVQIHNKLPIQVQSPSKAPNGIEEFYLEFNTSKDDFFRPDERDLVTYVWDFAVLKDISYANVPNVLVKPIAGAVPTPTPPPSSSPLPGDINLDHTVNSLDWSLMNSKWYTADSNSDLNTDGQVNSLDYAKLSSNWLKTW